jgi:hypothetical protein
MVFDTPLGWVDAAAACSIIGSYLVDVGSAAENRTVRGLIGTGSPAWIGLTDRFGEGTFVWFHGPGEVRAPTYTSWASGRPDNNPGGDADCAMSDGTGAWSDEVCTTARRYVCEHRW